MEGYQIVESGQPRWQPRIQGSKFASRYRNLTSLLLFFLYIQTYKFLLVSLYKSYRLSVLSIVLLYSGVFSTSVLPQPRFRRLLSPAYLLVGLFSSFDPHQM
jgi:hypothetical protein